MLRSCYRRSMAVAAELGARSVAFPAISTGVYAFPADRAATLAVETLRAAAATLPAAVDEVLLVAFDAPTLARYQVLIGSS